MLHVGLDMHKKFSVATVIDSEGQELISGERLENEEAAIVEFLTDLGEDARVVLEAGSNWYWMCDLLDELEIPNRLCHPLKTKAIASARIKSDKLDSRILAQLDRMDFVPESYKPDIATRYLREILRYRAGLVKVQTGIKNRTHALLTRINISNPYTDLFGKEGMKYLSELKLAPAYREAINGYMRMLSSLSKEISKAEKTLDKHAKSTPETRLLETIPGVGHIRSLTKASEIGDIDRFQTAKQLVSFAGLAPSTSQSGESMYHGHITRQGSRWLRWVLVEAAIHVVNKPGPLRDFYLKTAKRRGAKCARVAVARKLCTYVFHMLKEKKDYAAVISHVEKRSGVSPKLTLGN